MKLGCSIFHDVYSISLAFLQVTDPNVYHDFVSTGHIDERNNMIVYYSGQFPNVSHQYHAVAKVQFINTADGEPAIQGAARRGTEPLVLRNVEQQRLHDLLLYDFDEGEEGRREPEIEVCKLPMLGL